MQRANPLQVVNLMDTAPTTARKSL